MKILILNWRDIKHPLAGGAEIALLEHAKYWKLKKNEIIWFSSSFVGAQSEEIINGIKYIRRGSAYTVHLWVFLYYIRSKLGSPDLIIDNFHFIPFFTPLYMKNKRIFALINEVAGRLWFENLPFIFAKIGYYLEPIFVKVYKNYPFIVASESTYKDLRKLGIQKNTINIVHNGLTKFKIDKKIFKEEKTTIVFLGRISKDKGITDALKAFALVKKEIKNAQFWIIGKEEREGILNSVLNIASVKELKGHIHYLGFVSEGKKFELLKKAHILIHPSRKEGWGLTVIEAASQGTPTVGYNVEGLRDSIINGKTGILTPTNYQALAKNIILLVKDKRMFIRMSRNAIEWSENFTWGESTKKSWEILEKLK